MDKRTREALEASIKHWQENVEAKSPYLVSTSADDCALCGLFLSDEDEVTEKDCRGCPVAARAGARFCVGTPYTSAMHQLRNWRIGSGSREEFRLAAQKELDFLISLRPVEELPDASGLKALFDAVPPVGDLDELAARAVEEALAKGVENDD